MKNPERINLCSILREACHDAKYSTVKIIGAVNSALADLEVTQEKETTKGSLVTKQTKNRKPLFRLNQQVLLRYETESISVPLRFDAWNSFLEKCETMHKQICGTSDGLVVVIPPVFTEWLDKFARKEETPEQTPEQANPVHA